MSTETKGNTLALLEEIAGGPLTLGDLLRAIRLGEEQSQTDLANRLEISRSHLCDIEKGRKSVAPGRAAQFARVLGYSEAQFVRLALQALVEEAGLDFRVQLARAS